MTLKAALTVLALTLGAQGALGAELSPPTLRSAVTVTGGIVHIGDLVRNAGPAADIAVFRAPALGETGTVSAAQVADAVKAHAILDLDLGGITNVSVTRAARTIPAKDIETLLVSTLARSYGLGAPSNIKLTTDRRLRNLRVEPSVTAAPEIDEIHYDDRSTRFSALVSIPGASGMQFGVTGTAVVTTEAVALARPLARGEIITLDDLTIQRVPRDQISSDTITDPDQAIGLAARVAIANGGVLRVTDVMKPQLVQRNDTVTLVYQVPGIMLAVRGKALDSGAEGDMVDVVNAQSNRTVRGTIIGPGQVRVASLTARVTAVAQATTVGAGPGRSK